MSPASFAPLLPMRRIRGSAVVVPPPLELRLAIPKQQYPPIQTTVFLFLVPLNAWNKLCLLYDRITRRKVLLL